MISQSRVSSEARAGPSTNNAQIINPKMAKINQGLFQSGEALTQGKAGTSLLKNKNNNFAEVVTSNISTHEFFKDMDSVNKINTAASKLPNYQPPKGSGHSTRDEN